MSTAVLSSRGVAFSSRGSCAHQFLDLTEHEDFAHSIRQPVDSHSSSPRRLATARFIAQREDVLFLGPPGTGTSHLAQAIGRAAILQGYRVVYREAHTLLEELAEATLAGTRKACLVEPPAAPQRDRSVAVPGT